MPHPETYQQWICLAVALAGYPLLMLANPARESLRDGLRCLRRHGSIWMLLALFGLCYVVFQIGLDLYEHSILPEGMGPVFQWSRPWFLPREALLDVLKASVLPALEGVAGVFNVLITTFPFSAVAAVLFFVNWEGHHAVLLRALRHKFGGWGWLVYAGILLCAAAALAKPFLFTALFLKAANSMEEPLRLLQWSSVIDWLSFLFEIMFGICVQIYLILMVYIWVRGLNFTHRHLVDFAIRRFSYVMKWSAVGMLLGTALIYLPMIAANIPELTRHFGGFGRYFEPDTVFYFVDHMGRPAMAVFLIVFSGMQVILTFHSESLAKAARDLFHFLRKDAWTVGWYLVVAFLHFYFLAVLDTAVRTGFGEGSAPAYAWRLFYPLLAAFVGGWMLAAWVCLYKRSGTGRVRDENWIQY
jgi:hypothetical protein